MEFKIITELHNCANASDAVFLQRFFKTGPGEYGEGDKFLGIRMPKQRQVAKRYAVNAELGDMQALLKNEYHEVRMTALLIMTYQFKKAEQNHQKALYDLYIKQAGKAINNWDLVDVTAPHIVGAYLTKKNRDDLYMLAKGDLWQRRISIISTFWFIKLCDFSDALNLAEILVYDKHDLIHKAVGWVLREISKYEPKLLYDYLDKYAGTMPRTALRYALEKTPSELKRYYMNLKNI
jgi:3-methyladenine DNA glycosylase AlkD